MATLAELAKHLDMQVSNLQKLIAQGVIAKQDKGQYNLDQARSEYIHHFRAINQGRMTKDGLDLQAERARLAKEQADAKEMENAIERGDLVYIEDVAKQFENQLTKVRTKLLALPTKLAPECHASATLLEVQSIIEAGIVESLNELVGYDQAQTSEEVTEQAD